MPNRVPPPVGADFDSAWSFLKEKRIASSPKPAVVQDARKVHRAMFSLILWRFRLKRLPEHSRAFIEEIASDALQVLPQCLMGYSKTTKLLMRGIIENTMRHLYFSDHPIEFARMNREEKWYVSIEDLFGYANWHPAFAVTEKKYDAIQRLKLLYTELSAGVHGRRVQDLEMRTALNKIVFDPAALSQVVRAMEKCAASANFLLAVFHIEKVREFRPEDRRIILQTMPLGARKVWSDLP